MIKTLRITSVLAAALAVVVFSLSVVYGMRSDPAIEEFLNSPGVMAQFDASAGARAPRSSSQISPLVQQAQKLALILNPPPKPRPTTPVSRKPPTRVVQNTAPRPMSAKFKVIGTSVHKSDPNMSLALIDEPGKGMSWVRQSKEVMHLKIVEIKDDVVVVSDGTRTFEQAAEPRPATVSLEGGPGSAATVTSTSGRSASTLPSPPVGAQRAALPPRPPVRQTPSSPEPTISDQESAALSSLVERLQKIQREAEGADAEKAMNDVMSNFATPKVGSQEAQKLNELGRELKRGDREEPNIPRRVGSKISPSIPRRPSISTRDSAGRP